MFAATTNVNNDESDGESYHVPKRHQRPRRPKQRLLSETLQDQIDDEVS